LWEVCRYREGADEENATAAAAPQQPQQTQTQPAQCEPCLAIAWPCHKCGHLNYDQQSLKCEIWECSTTRIVKPQQPGTILEKTVISNTFLNSHHFKTNEENSNEDDGEMLPDGFFIHDEYTAKVDSVQNFIEFAKTSGMNEALAVRRKSWKHYYSINPTHSTKQKKKQPKA